MTTLTRKCQALRNIHIRKDGVDADGNSKGWRCTDHGLGGSRKTHYGYPCCERVVMTVNDYGERVWIRQERA